MTLQISPISDERMLTMLNKNDANGWVHLYDKYAAAMYSIVWHFTDNNEVANKIFTEAFLQLKEKNILSKVGYALCPFLLRYMHNFASQYLKKWGINPLQSSKVVDSQLIHLLCTQCNSIKDVAYKLNITEEAAIKNLQREFLVLRNKN